MRPLYGSGAFLEAARGAERRLGAVPRASVVAGAAVGPAVGGGAFRVTGAAVFRPFLPLDPRPVILPPSADVTLAALQRFTYTYPIPE